jgi:HSP20 family protein
MENAMLRPLTLFNRGRSLHDAAEGRSVDPFFRLQHQMNRLFDDAFLPFSDGGRSFEATPRVDLCETDEALEAKVELPGVAEKDINVEIVDNVLSIRGEKRSERKEDDRAGFYFLERTFGSFQRSIPLPVEIDPDRVSAVFRDGVLTLTLAKLPEAKSRKKRIAIQRG